MTAPMEAHERMPETRPAKPAAPPLAEVLGTGGGEKMSVSGLNFFYGKAQAL